jgi:hypothetical protein
MTVELNDEVTVPRFEDKLWHELARVHEQECIAPSPADVDLGFPAARRPLRTGLALIAAATIVIAGIVVTRSDDRPADALQARIIAATETALADSVVYSVTDFGDRGGRDEHWFDETTGMSRLLSYAENGELAREFTLARAQGDRPPTYTIVDHGHGGAHRRGGTSLPGGRSERGRMDHRITPQRVYAGRRHRSGGRTRADPDARGLVQDLAGRPRHLPPGSSDRRRNRQQRHDDD